MKATDKKRKKALKGEIDWPSIEIEYRANVLTLAEICRKYATKESTIRSRAVRNGWVREPKSERASKVREALLKESQEKHEAKQTREKKLTTQKADRVSEAVSIGRADPGKTVESLIDEAVDQDVRDMNLGLANARKALIKAGQLMDSVTAEVSYDPETDKVELEVDSRDLKMLTEITKLSVEIIRKIRGLDEKEDPEKDLSDWSEEKLRAELERLS